MGKARAKVIAAAVVPVAVWCCASVALGQAKAPPHDWFAPLKNIPIGPGKLSVDYSLRTRWEHHHNFNIKGFNRDKNDDLLLLRQRVGLDYRLSRDAHFYVQMQDARFWCSDLTRDDFPATCAYHDEVELREAYVEWKHIAGSPLGFKVGRQSISYADKRVFGPGNWGNVGRYWWDAAKLYVDTDVARVDVIYGRRIISEPIYCNDRHYDYEMLAVYGQIKKLPLKLHPFWVLRYHDRGHVNGEDGPGDQETHTLGFHADGKAGRWDYGGTLAGQLGKYGQDDVCAYGANGRLGYTFDAPWKPRIGAEFSYASGDSDPTDGRHETFDGVFGAVDCFYGRMNLLSWMNLEDYQLTFSVQPLEKLKIWLGWHFFRLASDNDAWYWCSGRAMRRDATGRTSRTLGHEIDLMAKWEVTRNLELFVGYAHFFPGPFVKGTPGTDNHADWVFAQVMFHF